MINVSNAIKSLDLKRNISANKSKAKNGKDILITSFDKEIRAKKRLEYELSKDKGKKIADKKDDLKPKDEKKEIESDDCLKGKKVKHDTKSEGKEQISKEEVKEIKSSEISDELQALILQLIGLMNSNGSEEQYIIQEENSVSANNNFMMNIISEIKQADVLSVDMSELINKIKNMVDAKQSLEGSTKQTFSFKEVEGKIQEIFGAISETKIEQPVIQGEVFDGKSGEESKDDDVEVLNTILNGNKKPVNNALLFSKIFGVKESNTELPVRANHMAQDVVKSIRFMSLDNLKELTVKVIPKELGEIAIKLTVDSGVMKASITAQNKDTVALLQSNGNQIQEKLAENGIKIENVDISIYQEDTTFHKDSQGQQSFQNQLKGKMNQDAEEGESAEGEDQEIQDDYTLHALV